MAACAFLYLFNSSRERSDDGRSTAAPISSKSEGWDQLVVCTPASSFDDKKTLILRRDNTALIREKIQEAEPQKLTWAYDAETKQLSIDGDGGGVFTVIDRVSGSPCNVRERFTQRIITDLANDWASHGAEAIVRLRENDVSSYMRICASLLPKEVQLPASPVSPLDDLSDEELSALVHAAKNAVAKLTRAE